MSRLIDADAKITALLYDEEHEETQEVKMSIADFLDSHTVEGCPQNGGWISVKDRLPVRPPDVCGLLVRRQWYLVALESGAVLTLAYEFDEDRWQGVGSPVTHWMPMPELPEEDVTDGNH